MTAAEPVNPVNPVSPVNPVGGRSHDPHDLRGPADLRDLTIGYSSLAHRTGGIRPPTPATGAEVLVCVQGGEPAPG